MCLDGEGHAPGFAFRFLDLDGHDAAEGGEAGEFGVFLQCADDKIPLGKAGVGVEDFKHGGGDIIRELDEQGFEGRFGGVFVFGENGGGHWGAPVGRGVVIGIVGGKGKV